MAQTREYNMDTWVCCENGDPLDVLKGLCQKIDRLQSTVDTMNSKVDGLTRTVDAMGEVVLSPKRIPSLDSMGSRFSRTPGLEQLNVNISNPREDHTHIESSRQSATMPNSETDIIVPSEDWSTVSTRQANSVTEPRNIERIEKMSTSPAEQYDSQSVQTPSNENYEDTYNNSRGNKRSANSNHVGSPFSPQTHGSGINPQTNGSVDHITTDDPQTHGSGLNPQTNGSVDHITTDDPHTRGSGLNPQTNGSVNHITTDDPQTHGSGLNPQTHGSVDHITTDELPPLHMEHASMNSTPVENDKSQNGLIEPKRQRFDSQLRTEMQHIDRDDQYTIEMKQNANRYQGEDQQPHQQQQQQQQQPEHQQHSRSDSSNSKPVCYPDITSDQQTARDPNEPEQPVDVSDLQRDKPMQTPRRSSPNSVNFNLRPLRKRSPSPLPISEKKKRVQSSCFKRMQTDAVNDNRPSYFAKAFDVVNLQGDLGHIPVDVLMEDGGEIRREEIVPIHQPRQTAENGHPRLRNNQQIAVSGFKNEHGDVDNRFVEEAHADSTFYQSRRLRMSNLTVIKHGGRRPIAPGSQSQTQHHSDKSADKPIGDGGGGDHAGLSGDRSSKKDQTESDVQTVVTDVYLQQLIDKQKNEASAIGETKAEGIDTVICLDTSASMDGKPLKRAKGAILSFLEGLELAAADYELEENVAIVTFGKENRVLQHLTNNYDAVRDCLENIEADGPSPLWLGLALSVTELTARGGSCNMSHISVPPRIITITDGFTTKRNVLAGSDVDTVDEEAVTEVLDLVERNAIHVCTIDCITVGKYNTDLLTGMSNGRVYEIADLDYLAQFFRTQDAANTLISRCKDTVLSDQELLIAIQPLGLNDRSSEEVISIVRNKVSVTPMRSQDSSDRPPSPKSSHPTSQLTTALPDEQNNKEVNPHTTTHTNRPSMDSSELIPSPKLDISKTQSSDRLIDGQKATTPPPATPVTPEVDIDDVLAPAFGTKVNASTDWIGWQSRQNLIGTVIGPRKKGQIKVLWTDGTIEKCKYGVNGNYDINVVPEPAINDGQLRIGATVERGPDWRWGDQDGGVGSIGVVLKTDKGGTVIHVIWSHGVQGNYRFGFNKKYDIQVCSEIQKAVDTNHSAIPEKLPFWQIQTLDSEWLPFPDEISKSIEDMYTTKPMGTCLVKFQDKSYRIMLSSLQARDLESESQHICPIRRRDLMDTEQ